MVIEWQRQYAKKYFHTKDRRCNCGRKRRYDDNYPPKRVGGYRESSGQLKTKDEQMNRLITQIEESNSILKTTILGTYTGFPATPTDLGVKNPPIKSELK